LQYFIVVETGGDGKRYDGLRRVDANDKCWANYFVS